jgi:hypothetical protein
MNDRREVAIQGYREWLDRFRWSWFATLKVTSGFPSDRKARRMFESWIAELEARDGASDFRWAAVLEKGADGTNRHLHVLVGGLRNRRQFWTEQWDRRGGQALIEPYDSSRNGILYLLKSTTDDGDLGIEFGGLEPKRKT